MQHQTHFKNLLSSILQEEKLKVVDVGSTGGPELRWKNWESLCFFYTFDPDPRTQSWPCASKNYPIGLWSERSTQTLHLAKYPPASSIFPPNQEVLASFAAAEALEQVSTSCIELDTLDHVLKDQSVDFIKIDAEGSELEILKGAQKLLTTNCLGAQLEVLFCRIRQQMPIFAEIDHFMHQAGFQLFQLEREHWIRRNNISTFESSPQLIWANTLYLLPKKAFLAKLQTSEHPRQLFAKYLLILLSYRLYDYAYELCEEVAFEEAKLLKEALLRLSKPTTKDLLPLLGSLFIGLCKYSLARSQNAKRHRMCYLRRKLRQLGAACFYFAKNNYAIYDSI